MDVHSQVVERSGRRCEAMVSVGGTWTRCFRYPVEVHHMLTRSRGGLILDAAGETAHLLALCPPHHKVAHSPGGHQGGLMINGYVTTGEDGSPVYQGSDPRLRHLQPMAMPAMLPEARDTESGEGMRGQT